MGKIHCFICKRKCKGDVLKLDQIFIHKECFNCHECGNNLERSGFFQRDGSYYCADDYQKQFGVKCGICNNCVDGEVVKIFGATFHTQCFNCYNCRHSLRCGDKATLWDDHYLCERCAHTKFEKENVSPPSVTDHKSTIDSDLIVPDSDTPMQSGPITKSVVTVPYTDSSDTDCPPMKPNGYLHLHIENGYTSTDSGVEKTKSEFGYLSPCYSTSSGDECWVRSYKSRKTKTMNYFQFGKCLNQSYLTIEKRISERTPTNTRYRTVAYSIVNDSKNPHFHRPDNFSYRSQPNINSKRGMSLLVYDFLNKVSNKRSSLPLQRAPKSLNNDDPFLNLTEEVKRLAQYPDGKEPDFSCDRPIDRFDFPAPAFTTLVIQDFKKERTRNRRRNVSSTADIFSDAFSGTDTTMDSTDYTETEDERIRNEKVERRIQALKSTGKYSSISQSVLDEFERQTTDNNESIIDPVSLSRSPDASFEPHYKTRYDGHTFTSPSRDNRYEGRPVHQLQSKMQYSSTGGRLGTMSGYTSTPHPGYTQGYMSCVESSAPRHPTNSLPGRSSSLPRPLNAYSAQRHIVQPVYIMDEHMSPSMTTSGYSVDATSHSIDESTLIGGSGILPRGGYTSDMAQTSSTTKCKSMKPDRYYESDNDTILHSNYPTVQSYLKPSSLLRTREKIPAQVIPYEKLKISNFSLPKGLDRTKLEIYLSDVNFPMIFHMTRHAFNRLPEWKRNDLKQKVDLY